MVTWVCQDCGLAVWQSAALVAATIMTGLTAGVLFAFACSVMPGLGGTDDRIFVAAFQAMDRAIINPLFLIVFVGSPAFCALAVVLNLGTDQRSLLWWAAAALVLSLLTVAITRVVHLPLNAAIQAAENPDQISDLAAVRQRFESTWVRWNIIRTATSTAALGCLTVALAL